MRSLMIRLGLWLIRRTMRRRPDFIIGGADRPYLLRWYLTPWRAWYRDVPEAQLTRWQRIVLWCARRLPVVYLHQFLRSDDDRALHDHPWLFNCSVLLAGNYIEHTISQGGIHHRNHLEAGDIVLRLGRAPHRIELASEHCWTLFIAGPVVRDWGFHCPKEGWIPWQRFTATGDPGDIGRGCDA